MGIVLNDQQEECVKKAVSWFHKISSKQTFEISGPAGSGKTTIVRTIIQELGINIEDVLFVAYVGKAALQLTRSCCKSPKHIIGIPNDSISTPNDSFTIGASSITISFILLGILSFLTNSGRVIKRPFLIKTFPSSPFTGTNSIL